jgi:hypothetical protein
MFDERYESVKAYSYRPLESWTQDVSPSKGQWSLDGDNVSGLGATIVSIRPNPVGDDQRCTNELHRVTTRTLKNTGADDELDLGCPFGLHHPTGSCRH